MMLEARRVAGSGRYGGACTATGPSPVPRAVGVDLQHRVVQLNRFGILGESDVGYGVLVETPERLTDLGRFKGGIHSIQHREGRPCEDQPSQGKQLLLAQRKNGRPIVLSGPSRQPAPERNPGLHRAGQS